MCLALTCLVLPACAAEDSQAAPVASQAAPVAKASQAPAAALENFDPQNYERSTQIDNEWMPLKPGTRFTYDGNTVEDDGTVVPHRIVITVTD